MRLVALLSLLVIGCPGPVKPPGMTAWDAGSLQLGVALSDTDPKFVAMPLEVQLHSGAQGGFHVPAMFQVTGQHEDAAVFEHFVRRARDSALVSRGTRTLDVSGNPWVTSQPIPIFMCPPPVGIDIIGEDLTFEVSVTSASGAVLSRETAKTRVKCPSTASYCASICKG